MLGLVRNLRFLAYLSVIVGTIVVNEKVLRFEISVNDTPRVAEIDAIDELKQEQFDLPRSNCGFFGTQISLEIMLSILKDQMQLLLQRNIEDVFETV